MKKIIGLFITTIFYLLSIQKAHAAAFSILSPGDNATINCQVGDSSCNYNGTVQFANDTDQPLYQSTLYTSSPFDMLEYQGFDGNWTSGYSQTSYIYQPGEGPSVQVRVTAPSQTGTWNARLYIDGKVCNQNTSPPNCIYYGGKEFRVTININEQDQNPLLDNPSPTPTPTDIPPTSPTPTNTPTPDATISPTPIPTNNEITTDNSSTSDDQNSSNNTENNLNTDNNQDENNSSENNPKADNNQQENNSQPNTKESFIQKLTSIFNNKEGSKPEINQENQETESSQSASNQQPILNKIDLFIIFIQNFFSSLLGKQL